MASPTENVLTQTTAKEENQLEKLERNLKDMGVSIELFSLYMRCLFHDKSITGQTKEEKAFINLRDTTKDHSKIYLDKIMPKNKLFITNLQQFFEYYKNLKLEEWEESLVDIRKEVRSHQKLCEELIDIHMNMSATLKKNAAAADDLCKHFGALKLEYGAAESHNQLMAKLSGGAGVGVFVMGGAAACVASAPVLAVLAVPVSIPFLVTSIAQVSESKKNEVKKNMAFHLGEMVTASLIPALESFILAIDSVARYYAGVETSLQMVGTGKSRMHFFNTRKKADDVIAGCQIFLQALPVVKSNFLAIND